MIEWEPCPENCVRRHHAVVGGFIVHRWEDLLGQWYCIIPVEAVPNVSWGPVWHERGYGAGEGTHKTCRLGADGECLRPFRVGRKIPSEEELVTWLRRFLADAQNANVQDIELPLGR